ncbi:lipopolysaccharide biosynthesis protein [Gellertiella hungarica]|uniref:O-antigen/teichoic acid export membrane protein n=1 Tax=Gellertiella hungarica TaxID=1572859 RepID=A0A7W6J3N0_9HYPH|nr:oligosaccharide flippase family protein [Gellertiella hungarica]MBB4064216.1 O-antigen/teichoic acid export membrane protein [Gellertiella hungarica]
MAQAIPILGSLLIARIFAPAEFGTFMTWFGLVSIGAVFVTGRFEMALALEPDGLPRAEAATCALYTTFVLLATLSLPAAVLYLFFRARVDYLPVSLLLLYAPAVAASACVLIFQAWAAAEGRFKSLSAMRIAQAGTITGLQIIVGLITPSAAGLATAHLIGVVTGVAFIARKLRPVSLPNGFQSVRKFWMRYRRFPMFSLPADTVNTAAAQLPLTILAHRFGADVAGYVAMAFRMLGAPISLLGSAVLDVFKRRASESWRASGSCRGPYLETLLVLAAGSAFATIFFWFFGEAVFVLAFGERWAEAGRAAVILLPLFALRFVASPLSYTFYIAQKQPVDLAWQICLLGMTLFTLLSLDTYHQSLTAYAMGYAALYAIYITLSYRYSAGRTT